MDGTLAPVGNLNVTNHPPVGGLFPGLTFSHCWSSTHFLCIAQASPDLLVPATLSGVPFPWNVISPDIKTKVGVGVHPPSAECPQNMLKHSDWNLGIHVFNCSFYILCPGIFYIGFFPLLPTLASCHIATVLFAFTPVILHLLHKLLFNSHVEKS